MLAVVQEKYGSSNICENVTQVIHGGEYEHGSRCRIMTRRVIFYRMIPGMYWNMGVREQHSCCRRDPASQGRCMSKESINNGNVEKEMCMKQVLMVY